MEIQRPMNTNTYISSITSSDYDGDVLNYDVTYEYTTNDDRFPQVTTRLCIKKPKIDEQDCIDKLIRLLKRFDHVNI